jgi:hypothetical protein
MNHLSEEQIVLHYYGDAEAAAEIEQHLAACAECRAEFARVQSTLRQIAPLEVPEPPASFEEKTWLNLRDRLPEKGGFLRRFLKPSQQKWALAGVMAVLLAAAFLAGRFWPRPGQQIAQQPPVQVNPQRVVLVAVGDHLERSQMLLIEVMNTDSKDRTEIASEQELARNLLDSNRLYRVSAQQTGNPRIAPVLDELERVLVEIANAPPDPTSGDLKEIRSRIQSQDLLFKIHVVHSNVTAEGDALSRPSANQRL